MKTIQMTIDEPLLAQVDRVASARKTTRSAFIREALLASLRRLELQAMEERHREAYTKLPFTSEELDVWQGEQYWGDE